MAAGTNTGRLKALLSGPVKSLAGIGLTVVIVQGLSFVANILTVRVLSVGEYALLTSSLSILGLLTAIADSGLSQAAMTVGGLHHGSEREKAEVLQRCRALVLRTGITGLVVIVPIWIWMAKRLDASTSSLIAVGVFLFGGFFCILGFNILKSFLLLEGKRVYTQRIDIARTVFRVVLLAAGIHFLPSAAYFILCATASEIAGWWFFRNALSHLLKSPAECGTQIKNEVSAVFWRLMPTTIYKAISPQIFLLLLVAFGSTASVAGAGALSRFHQVFIFVPTVVATVFSPRLARASGRGQRTRLMIVFTFVGWLSAFSIFAFLFVFASPLLSLLGPKYAGLQTEFRMLMASSCLYTMAGSCSGLLNTRGWITPPQLLIATDILFTVVAIIFCDVATLRGFTLMHCILALGSLTVAVVWTVYCLLNKSTDETLKHCP
jgi:O-antigen/teichoic acid export membrane protein